MRIKTIHMETTIYQLILFISLPMFGWGQQQDKKAEEIRGTVLSAETLQPLPGATISIEGSKSEVLADARGSFFLSAPQGTKIKISFIGYQGSEILVDSVRNKMLTVYLQPNNLSLKEVVVSTGYQQIARQKTTGSFEKIKSELFTRNVSTDVLTRLEGLITGLNVDKRTGNNSISIRGLSTIYANSQPLIILNDFPYDGDISNINPNDVEDITILKDASAASIWGARAGNGVIVITTKSGKDGQVPAVDFSSAFTKGEKPDIFYLPRISSADFIDNEVSLFNRGFYSSMENAYDHPVLSPVVELLIKQRDGVISEEERDGLIETMKQNDVRNDFQKYWYKTAQNQQYSVNLKGGAEKVRYYFSAGYDKNVSSLSSRYNRFTVSSANSFYPLKPLEITTRLNYTRADNVYGRDDYLSVSSGNGISLYPYAQIADEQGIPLSVFRDYRQVFKETAELNGFLNWDYFPFSEAGLIKNTSRLNDVLFNIGAGYKLPGGLAINLKYQLEQSSGEGRVLYDRNSYYTRSLINQYTQQSGQNTITRPIPEGGVLNLSNAKTVSHSFRSQVDYNRDWRRHSVSALAGYELKDLRNTQHTSNRYGFNDDVLTSVPVDYSGFFPLSGYSYYVSATIPDNTNFLEQINRFVSLFSNIAYTYNGRYTISASVRKDASNLFGVNTNQKAVPLYSTGMAWELSKENFYRFSFLPYLKIRATYGYNGNIDNSLSAFTTIAFYSGANLTNRQYAAVRNPPNPNLIWEKTAVTNIGIDFSSLNNIVSGSLDYYHKSGKDLIGYGEIDPTSGYKNPTNPTFPNSFKGNVAAMKGNGIDFTLHTQNLNRAFKWVTDLQASWSVNRISKYMIESEQGSNFINSGLGIAPLKGKPVYSVLSYKWNGLDPENGNPLGSINGEISSDYSTIISGSSVDDLVYSGPALPPYFGSLRNTFSFKGFSLSANILYKFGHYFRRNSISYSALYNNWNGHGDYGSRWQEQGDELFTNVPSAIYPADPRRDEFYLNSEILIEKADFVRLKDVSFSYSLSKKMLRKLHLKSVQLYTYADNLAILWRANRHNIDPDFGTAIPAPRTISIGLRAGL